MSHQSIQQLVQWQNVQQVVHVLAAACTESRHKADFLCFVVSILFGFGTLGHSHILLVMCVQGTLLPPFALVLRTNSRLGAFGA